LKALRLSSIPGASEEETEALKRNTIWPRQDFIVLPLESSTIKSIVSAIGGTIPNTIIQIQIEKGGSIQFAAYDNFHPQCIVFHPAMDKATLESLVSEGLMRVLIYLAKPGAILAPWQEAPYSLVSWWDVEKFAAQKFCYICGNLAGMSGRFQRAADLNLPHTSQDIIWLTEALEKAKDNCNEIGLTVSAIQIVKANDNLKGYIPSPNSLHPIQISQLLVDLNSAIASEMSTHLFLRVPSERAKFYEQEQLFGSVVDTNFNSAHRDIKASGSCYANGQTTASVMHLMRVLELGLLSLANKLGVPIRKPDWENIINDIEAAIKKINGPSAGPNWKEERDFYSAAAKDFRYLKNAWRNHAMHVREHYDEPEARSILDHVKAFMGHLAENGLRE
jgi:hypothetical protein